MGLEVAKIRNYNIWKSGEDLCMSYEMTNAGRRGARSAELLNQAIQHIPEGIKGSIVWLFQLTARF
jgi:hypothetical protein